MKHIYLKTSRTKSGEAHATISKFYNFTQNKYMFAFSFYQDRKFFDTFKETMDYVNSKYEIVR